MCLFVEQTEWCTKMPLEMYSVQNQPMIYFDFIGGNRRLAVKVGTYIL